MMTDEKLEGMVPYYLFPIFGREDELRLVKLNKPNGSKVSIDSCRLINLNTSFVHLLHHTFQQIDAATRHRSTFTQGRLQLGKWSIDVKDRNHPFAILCYFHYETDGVGTRDNQGLLLCFI